MIDTARQASNILQAWKLRDASNLSTALDHAARSCFATPSASKLESEREEMLQSIVEHMRKLAGEAALPDSSKAAGALKLLSHLSTASFASGHSEIENDCR